MSCRESATLIFTWLGLILKLSTTEKDASTLSDVFSENVGTDETIVFDKDEFELHAEGGQGPRRFDYLHEFDQPFLYDPARGNLLLEACPVPVERHRERKMGAQCSGKPRR